VAGKVSFYHPFRRRSFFLTEFKDCLHTKTLRGKSSPGHPLFDLPPRRSVPFFSLRGLEEIFRGPISPKLSSLRLASVLDELVSMRHSSLFRTAFFSASAIQVRR